MTEASTCSLGDAPAKATASRVCEKDSKTHEAISPSSLSAWLIAHGCVGSFLRTCRASLVRESAAAILPSSYRSSSGGKSPYPSADGAPPASSPTLPAPSGWHGECLTLSIPEWPRFPVPSPSEDVVSSLSDILETGAVPPKYSLTETCAAGILHRAERRGRPLPEILRLALEAVVCGCAPARKAEQRRARRGRTEPHPRHGERPGLLRPARGREHRLQPLARPPSHRPQRRKGRLLLPPIPRERDGAHRGVLRDAH